MEQALRRIVISTGGGAVIFGVRFSDKEYFLERLARRPPVLDRWAEERVREAWRNEKRTAQHGGPLVANY
jgi:hypothetical protein